jgi:hypothetical protein
MINTLFGMRPCWHPKSTTTDKLGVEMAFFTWAIRMAMPCDPANNTGTRMQDPSGDAEWPRTESHVHPTAIGTVEMPRVYYLNVRSANAAS